MRVKLFEAFGTWSSLDDDINRWLEKEGRDFKIIDIKYSTCGGNASSSVKSSALVLYEQSNKGD